MKKPVLKTDLYWQLLQLAINTKHLLMKISDKHGLSVMQLYTLCLLEADTSIPMNSLSSKLHCDASNVTGIVERLFHQEYIKREENPDDRREKMITLTPLGAKLCEKISQEIFLSQPKWIRELSKDQKKQLQNILSQALSPMVTK